jgi:hypothetical protein
MERMSSNHRLIGTETPAIETETESASLRIAQTAIERTETDEIVTAQLTERKNEKGIVKGRKTENALEKETEKETARGRKSASSDARSDLLSAVGFSWERLALPTLAEEIVAVIAMMAVHEAVVAVPTVATETTTRRRTRRPASSPPC